MSTLEIVAGVVLIICSIVIILVVLAQDSKDDGLTSAIGGGYSIAFGEHFRLNLGVGIGPILTHYRYYEGRMANQHLMYRYSGNWQYFGVTDAKISITWLFYRKKK